MIEVAGSLHTIKKLKRYKLFLPSSTKKNTLAKKNKTWNMTTKCWVKIFMTPESTVHVKITDLWQKTFFWSQTLSHQCPFNEEIYFLKNLMFQYLPEEISAGLSKPEKRIFFVRILLVWSQYWEIQMRKVMQPWWKYKQKKLSRNIFNLLHVMLSNLVAMTSHETQELTTIYSHLTVLKIC